MKKSSYAKIRNSMKQKPNVPDPKTSFNLSSLSGFPIFIEVRTFYLFGFAVDEEIFLGVKCSHVS